MPQAYASTVVNAPAETVWAAIRDFGALQDWHPAVVKSGIEDGRPASEVGCVRSLQLADGAQLRERLLAFSDSETSYSYNFETTPFAVLNYRATLRVQPITSGNRAFVEWFSRFDCDTAEIDHWVDTFAGAVFKGGLDALEQRFGG